MAITLSIARVSVALPYHNHYLVAGPECGEVLAVAGGSGSGRRGSHNGTDTYVPGSWVLVAVRSYTAASAPLHGPIAIIVCGLDLQPLPKQTDYRPSETAWGSNATLMRNEAVKALLGAGNEQLNQDRSYGRPLDVCAGDWLKYNQLGGMFLLSAFFARMAGSALCQLTLNGQAERADLRTRDFWLDTPAVSRQVWHRGQASLALDDYAFNVLEGMGQLGSGKALKPGTQDEWPAELVPQEALQAGYFRRRTFSGGAVEGLWDTISTALTSDTTNVFGGQTMPGVLSMQARMDGTYRVRAVREIKFERTGSIVVPQQQSEVQSTELPADKAQAFDQAEAALMQQTAAQQQAAAFELSAEEIEILRPIMHEALAEQEESTVFYRGLRRDGDLWVLPKVEDVRQALLGDAPPQLPVLPTQQQQYGSQDLGGLLTDPLELYPGRKVQLFKNSSVFLMAEDGGIVLGDGYGAELRMHRGHVTLTGIGDITVAPGRDLLIKAPGNLIANAGDRVEITSTRGSIALKAQQNFQVLAGAGEEVGLLLLENRAPAGSLNDITDTQLHQGAGLGSGVILKSRAGLQLLGQSLYAGANVKTASTPSTAGLDAEPMSVWLNCGAGSFRAEAGTVSLLAATAMGLSMRSTLTGLYLGPYQHTLVSAGTLATAAPAVVFDHSAGAVVDRPDLTNSQLRVLRQSIPGSNTQVYMQGKLRVADEIMSSGQITSEQRVVANDGCNQDPLSNPGRFKLQKLDSAGPAIDTQLASIAAADQTLMAQMVQQGMATAYGQRATDFAFPDSNSACYRASDYTLLGYRWQALLKAGKPWVENPVPHSMVGRTYPHPGAAAREPSNLVLTLPSLDGGKPAKPVPLDQYPTNLE